MSDLDKISSVFNAKIDTVKTKDDLQNIKTEFFGKNGQITQQFKSLGSLDPEKRKELIKEAYQNEMVAIDDQQTANNLMDDVKDKYPVEQQDVVESIDESEINELSAEQEQENEFIEKLVHVNRITKVVKGGRRFGFSALVVVGNQSGKIGIAHAKSMFPL